MRRFLLFLNHIFKQVWSVHEQLSAIGPMFSIAAAFGNVHGVYKAGNVTLQPERCVIIMCAFYNIIVEKSRLYGCLEFNFCQ